MRAGRVFFDTNILLYILSSDKRKADTAEKLLDGGGTISVQVLNEFASVARQKEKVTWAKLHETLAAIRAACDVVPLTAELHDEGLRIAERYGFSVYDSMIVAAAIASGCDTIYSEDLQAGQIIGHTRVSNPF